MFENQSGSQGDTVSAVVTEKVEVNVEKNGNKAVLVMKRVVHALRELAARHSLCRVVYTLGAASVFHHLREVFRIVDFYSRLLVAYNGGTPLQQLLLPFLQLSEEWAVSLRENWK